MVNDEITDGMKRRSEEITIDGGEGDKEEEKNDIFCKSLLLVNLCSLHTKCIHATTQIGFLKVNAFTLS